MRRGSDLIGKLVVAYNTGEGIARAWDLIFDQTSNQLLGFLLSEGGWLKSAQIILLSDVTAIGLDAIVVPSEKTVVKAKNIPHIRQVLEHNIVLRGTQIMTTQGTDLGTMVDLYFNDQTGVVEGYEVSGGLFADVYSGRSFVPAPQTLNIGKSFAFVPPEIAELMEEQIGGIKGTVLATGDKLQTTTDIAVQKFQEITDSVSEKLQETTTATNQKLQEVTHSAISSLMNSIVDPEQQRAFVIGKTVDRDVLMPDGTLLLAKGGLVTPEIANLAQQATVLGQLYQAVGGSFADDLSHRIQEATTTTHEQLQEVIHQGVSTVLSSIVDPTEQKAFMVGKTVDADVVSPDGTTLVMQGQLVTTQLANAAEDQGVLDQLYRAVGGSFAEELNRKVQATTASTQQRLQAVVTDAVATVTNTIVDPVEQKSFVLGKSVDQDIHLPDGRRLIAQDQTVSAEIIEQAQQQQILDQVYRAVGGSVATDLTHQVQKATTTTHQELQAVINQAVSSMMSNIVDPAEQKEFVIGKAVDQDISLPEGTLLIPQGQTVSPALAEQAEQQHVLDQLYRAVGGSFAADLGRRASDIMAGTVVEQAVGRRVQREVRTGDGVVIAAAGQIVTESVVDRARKHNQESALITSTGLTPNEAVQSSGGMLISETGDRLRQGVTQAADSTSSLWKTLQESVIDVQQRSSQYIETRRIHRALGRPVTRVILDREDKVILNIGELITHEAIERARQANLLDILLSSVYMKQPELPQETLRAPTSEERHATTWG